ncbi:MAG: GNAT family N-acetyltransferase [Candidatus Staskawiczbacteria bacterium]|nr:GNAT family N-acetyltransferase [Candidatus Staskawiczbacteria bacterium]
MSGVERGNFSENDMTPEEWEKALESRAGEIIEPFEWEGKKGVVRYAKSGDAEGLLTIDRDRAEYRLKEYKKAILRTPGGGNESLKKSLEEPEKQVLIVLQIEDEIVGYTTFGLPVDTEDWGEDTIQVFTTSVLQMKPEYKRINKEGEMRGYGFGEKLRKYAIRDAKNIFHAKYISSNVHNWNKPSLGLWKKLGSRPTGKERPEIDGDGNQVEVVDPKTEEKVKSVLIRMKGDLDEMISLQKK